MSELLISVSGVRGIIGEALTAEIALRYALAFGTYLKSGKIAIGGDTRRTGPMVKSAAMAGLMASGHDVVDIGVCPTPTVEMAVRDGGFVGGIAVTASHNPDPYNALKLIGPGGLFLSESQGQRVKEIYSKNRIKNVGWEKVGISSQDDHWIDWHVEKIAGLDIIDTDKIGERNLLVVVDCVGGTAAFMAAKMFSRLGVRYQLINTEHFGRFPHSPEPTPDNLTQLMGAVKAHNADIGLAFDPDSDRLAIVSERAEAIGEEYTLALGCRYILSQHIGPLAVNVSSSLINEFVAQEAGTKLYRARVGERNVTEKLMRTGGIAGGEGNGGLIYPQLHWGRDAFLAAAVILQYMALSGKPIGQLAQELPRYAMLKTKVQATGQDLTRKLKGIEKLFPKAKISRLDGIKFFGDDWWVQIRASNTEPILRLMAEAPEMSTANSLLQSIKQQFTGKSGGKK